MYAKTEPEPDRRTEPDHYENSPSAGYRTVYRIMEVVV
jgi:hypothetical protein